MPSSFRNGRYRPSIEPDWSGSLVARCSKTRVECAIRRAGKVGEIFVESRLGEHGHAFGTLPAHAPRKVLLERALPA